MKSNCSIICLFICANLTSCTLPWSNPTATHQDNTLQKNIQVNIDTIKMHDRVNISYQLKDENNRIADSGNDITVVVWSGSIPFLGLHESLIGMQESEKRTLQLPANKLYGDERQNRILRKEQLLEISQKSILIEDLQKYKTEFEGKKFIVINKTKSDATLRLINSSPLFLWDTLEIGQESDYDWNGGTMKVEKIEWEYVTVSYPTGHPLSGKSLNLEIEVKKILK